MRINYVANEIYMAILKTQKRCIELLESLESDKNFIEQSESLSDLDFQPGNKNRGSWVNPDFMFPSYDFEVTPKSLHSEEKARLKSLVDICKTEFYYVNRLRLTKIKSLKFDLKFKDLDGKLTMNDIVLIVEKKHPRLKFEHLVTLDENPRAMHIEYTFGLTFSEEGRNYKCKFKSDYQIYDERIHDAISDGVFEGEEYKFEEGEIKIVEI